MGFREIELTVPSLRLMTSTVVGFACLLSSQGVHALAIESGAPIQASNSDSLQEIVVTARRREESLQSVPVATSAYNGELLKEQSVKTVSDLQTLVPTLII